MERNSSGAFGANGKSDHYAILSSCSLHITHVCWLPAVLRPSVLRPSAAAPLAPAAPAPPAPVALFSACGSVAILWQPMRVCSLAAVMRPSAAAAPLSVGAVRRLRRLSARLQASAALRCCRIRLHWPVKTPRPRATPPNGRGLRMKLKNDFNGLK